MGEHSARAHELVSRATEAARQWARLDQAATDRITEAIFHAAFAKRVELAKLAYEETGIGVLEHKVVKNAWASLLVYEDIRHRKTVGVLAEYENRGLTEIARPRGPILALTPVTNPSSTVIFKALICAKTRNPLIFSPHGGARKASREAARVCYEAALEAGAPKDAIQWLRRGQKDLLEAVMSHPQLALILATGTGDMVAWAQRSGNPVLGVGPGNVPVYVDGSADLDLAARSIAHSKTWDNGVVCASEQALIVTPEVDQKIRPMLRELGAHFCDEDETRMLADVVFDAQRKAMAVAVVGRPAATIAVMAGFTVGKKTRLLVAPAEEVGEEYPLSHEILAPVLSYFVVDDERAALRKASAVSHLGGIGHTVCVWTERRDVVERFVEEVPAGRVCVNQPATQGAIGGIYNTLRPSLSLGTGSGGGNLTTDNITIDHLYTVQRVTRRRENRRWLQVAREEWLDENIGPKEAHRDYNKLW